MLCRDTKERHVTAESSEKISSAERVNGNSLQHPCQEKLKSHKRLKEMMSEGEPLRSECVQKEEGSAEDEVVRRHHQDNEGEIL